MCHSARRFRAAVSSYPTGNEDIASVPLTINSEFEETMHTRRVVEGADGIAREGDWSVLRMVSDLIFF